MAHDLFLHQEIALLSLRDDKGTFSSGMYVYAMAGAMVSELLIHERIVVNDDKHKTVAVTSDKKTGNKELDELLQLIDESVKHKGLQHWVTKAAQIKELNHRVADTLCQLGILKYDEIKVLWLFTCRTYPELDGTWEDSIRARMASFMFDPKSEPDERTAVLIALASHSGLLKPNFIPEELRQYKAHIKKLAAGEVLAADAAKSAIEAVQTAVAVAVMVPSIAAATM